MFRTCMMIRFMYSYTLHAMIYHSEYSVQDNEKFIIPKDHINHIFDGFYS